MSQFFTRSSIANPKAMTAVLIGSVALFSLSQCRKRGDSANPGGLLIQGFAATMNGSPIPQAEIILEGSNTPIGHADQFGKFSVTIPENYLQSLTQGGKSPRTSWAVFVRKIAEQPLGGRSPTIDLHQRGMMDVGTINAEALSSFSGKIFKTNGSVLSPAAHARITLGPQQVFAGEDGSFSITNTVSGKSQLFAELDGFETAIESLTLPPGATYQSDTPYVLFNSKLANAILIPKTTLSSRSSDKAINSTGTAKSFYVRATPATKYIRFHHQLNELQKPTSAPSLSAPPPAIGPNDNQESQSKWRALTNELDYSFPSAGSASLWYQTSDQSGSQISEFKQASVQINPCDGFEGFTINNGNPITVTKLVKLFFKGLPINTTRLRISEDQSELMMSPWLASNAELNYLLSTNSRSGGGGGMGGGGMGGSSESPPAASRQIFAEVDTTTGTCSVVSSTVQYRPFPHTGSMFQVNDGSGLSPSKIVMVTIPQLPPNAVEMRLFDLTPSANGNSANASRSALWVRAQNQVPFFFNDIGARVIGMEFRDIDGATSPTYMSNIKITQENMVGFNIAFANYGTPPLPIIPPPSRYLVLQLLPPQAASTFRYVEIVNDGGNSNFGNSSTSSSCQNQDASAINSRPWLNLTPFLPIYSCGVGLRQFLVQYQTYDGIITTVTNSIFIPSAPEILGNFVINASEPLTVFPTVNLTVFPPISAKAMSATNLTMQQTTANTSQTYTFGSSMSTSTNDQWLNPTTSLAFRLDGRGVQTIQMRFRDENGNVIVPSIMKSIFYDPFPHFPEGIIPLKINNADTSTTSPLVTLSIKAPESSYSYRVSGEANFAGASEWHDIPTTIKSAVAGANWQMFEFTAPFIISGSAGPKFIYLQFRNELGDKSEIHSALIQYQP